MKPPRRPKLETRNEMFCLLSAITRELSETDCGAILRLAQARVRPYATRPMIRALIASALLLFGLTAAATARADISHAVAHSSVAVAAGEHHHHDSDGRVLDAHEEDPTSSKSHGDDVLGHSHGSTASMDLAHRAPDRAVIWPTDRSEPHEFGGTSALPTLAWSPHKRPPRAA